MFSSLNIDDELTVKRRCDFIGRNGYTCERIIDIREPEFIKIEIIEGTMPFNKAFALFQLTENNLSSTNVKLTMEIDPKGAFMGKMMAKVMMVPMMKPKLSQILEGLDYFVTTGKKIGVK